MICGNTKPYILCYPSYETEGFSGRVPGIEGIKVDAIQTSSETSTCYTMHDVKLPALQPGDTVRIRDQNRLGQVVTITPEPRSCWERTDLTTARHNRKALVPTSRESYYSSGPLTPHARVNTTSEITTPIVETRLPAT